MAKKAPMELSLLDKKVLKPEEKIYYFSRVKASISSDSNQIRNKDGLICTTNKRIILVFIKMFGHLEESYNYDEIRDLKVIKDDSTVTMKLENSRSHSFISSHFDGPSELLNVIKDIKDYMKKKEKETFNEFSNIYQQEIEKLKNEKNDLESKILEDKNLIKKLNEEYNYYNAIVESAKEETSPLIREYHKNLIMPFDNYDQIPSSHDLKTQLSLLKLNEKEIEDVYSLIHDDEILNKREHKSQQRQILRMFNVECDFIFSKMTHKNVENSHNKLVKTYEQLNKLFEVDNVKINKEILINKLDQLSLIAQYNIALEQEKQIRKEERERIAEEQKAEKELNNALTKLQKEENQFKNETDKLTKYMQNTSNDAEKEVYAEKIKQLQEQLKSLQDNKININKRLENTRAGYVYIISNVGSFGENIYKIGVTRRLEPRDRIKELSSASVPFEFDIHAIIFSDDAPKLENTLHKYFREYELNKINTRKEFFRVELDRIKEVVLQEHNDTVRFEMEAEAHQYRETLKLIESTTESIKSFNK